MYALTVRPPMSHAIVHLGKTTENRTNAHRWRGATGRTIAIHAGKEWVDEYAEQIECNIGRRISTADVAMGAVIGTARITDVHWSDPECCDPWGQHAMGVCHLTLDLIRPCAPITCRGQLGLWRLPDDIARNLELVRR